MDNARQQIVDSIKGHSNILVTVSTSPSVDELSAALGLTILLNNLDKRATAIVSGAIPPAINFLDPDKTFESTADSLRDFIIALDKEKADHLRYKVEGDAVKIFITPYRTTLSQQDLEFSQGDYNVELVIGLGVRDQDHLDKGLAAHGKILHDATVVTITAGEQASSLGSVDWHDGAASSLGEMMVSLSEALKTDGPILDQQIATAFLTGIVSATDRFSNDRTSSRVMTMAAQLMAAGANQQLIAAKLEEAHDIAPGPVVTVGENETDAEAKDMQPGSELTIERDDTKTKPDTEPKEKVIEPLSETTAESAPEPPQEVKDQLELEKQLAGLSAPSTGTMADIEKELKEAANNPPEQQDTPPILTAASDSAMPGFEPTEPQLPASPPSQEPEGAVSPDQPSVPDATAIPIINDHGQRGTEPTEQTSPINGVQSGPNEGEPTINPFNAPLAPLEEEKTEEPEIITSPLPPLMPPIEPIAPEQPQGGTPEGAALLSADPTPEPGQQPAIQQPLEPLSQPVSVPELPPLPPLPTDGSLPPLPPPPPPPSFGQPGPNMPVGGVPSEQLGDIFGDNSAQSPQPPQTPPEPGQYRIPGQPS